MPVLNATKVHSQQLIYAFKSVPYNLFLEVNGG